MDFRILGPIEVVRDGRRLPLRGGKQRALLALLLLHANEALSAEYLVDALWGERPPTTAAKALQVYVSRLRKLFAEHRAGRHESMLITAGSGYMLRLDDEQLDLQRFARLREQGRRALRDNRPGEAAQSLTDALRLWRGPALADVSNEEFAQEEVARLEELRLVTLEERIEADLQLGRHADLVGELEALVAEHPVRESLRSRLMLALYRAGRQAEALDAYQRTRQTLVEELGIEPSRSLRELEQAILRQDSTLDYVPDRSEASRASTASIFVGRNKEVATLRAGFEEAVRGHGGLYLLAGEPGIGKSRLAAQLIGHAQGRGAQVLVGRCWEAGGAPAYWPWVQSLRSYVRGCEPERLRTELGAGGPDLAQLLPEIRQVIRDLPELETTESEGARFRLFDAVSSFLTAAARTQPVVVVLDDLHAADEPSLLLLRFLARELADSRVLVVSVYRDVDPTLADPLAETIAELTREPVTHRIELAGLDESAVAEYIELTAGRLPLDGLVSNIHAETDGNPLFVGEVVRLLAAEGSFEASAIPELGVPEGVRVVIGRRLRHLSDECNRVLTLASVLGREIDLAALEHLAGTRRPDLLGVLDEAIAARVLSEVPGSAGRLRFAHVLVRDVLYETLSSARRAQIHQRIGEVLEQLYARDLDPHLSEVAHHFFEAAVTGDVEKALAYSRQAADRALALLAYEEACRLYKMALALSADGIDRCDLLLSLGIGQTRAGDTPAAKETFREAAERAHALHLPEQLARAALGYGGRFTWDAARDDEYLRPLLEHALDVLGDRDAALRARLLARLSAGPLRDVSYPPERRALLRREALDLARETGEAATIAYALNAYVISEGSPELTDERVELGRELVAAALAIGDKEVAMEAHSALFTDLFELADVEGALRELHAMETIAAELRQPSQYWFVATFRAQVALLQGRFAEAESLIAEAVALGERAQRWNATVSYRLQLYLLRREQGRVAEVEHLVQESVDAYPTYSVWRPIRAYSDTDRGPAEARQAFEALAANGFDELPRDEHWLVGLGLLAETAYALRDGASAARLYELLQPYSERVAVSYGEISIGAVSRYLGLLAATLGNRDDAVRHLDDALAINQRVGARPWAAHTQIDLARELLERGSLEDEEHAYDLLGRALATCRELGIPVAADRAAKMTQVRRGS